MDDAGRPGGCIKFLILSDGGKNSAIIDRLSKGRIWDERSRCDAANQLKFSSRAEWSRIAEIVYFVNQSLAEVGLTPWHW